MKCNILLLYLFCSLFIISSWQKKITSKNSEKIENNLKSVTPEWETRTILYRGKEIKLITLTTLNTSNADQMLELIDRSYYNKDPTQVESDYIEIIKKNDLIVITEKLLFWFSASSKPKRITRTGGGLLAGIWELEITDRNEIKLKPKDQKTFYVPNLLLTGSEPNLKLFSADVYGTYANKKIIWGIENSKDLRTGEKMGKKISQFDTGSYSENGVFVDFIGYITNSSVEKGFETIYDTDSREGIIGKTRYNLIYRIPADRNEIIQEIKFTAEKNNFGPISNAYMAMYLPGYKEKDMSWVSNPEMMPKNENTDLKKVSINKYFRNTSVRKVYFYDMNYKEFIGKKASGQTPPGRGRIACLGSPENKVHFFCGYPTNDFIPKEAYEEYSMEIADNQMFKKTGKIHSLIYKLFSDNKKSFTLDEGKSFNMIMRYKLIDASNAAAAQINKNK